ncbi:hypothetical protein G3N96_04170 [Burkholderia sp. Se-20373]|uniref:hypothetical protein n=1 Tax=Burkholderia sp. Se-20373 TaxID=2703898 RepID=UPI00198214C6|nr:hypothetical protein [Burkholderia sp. Se-20373]MBN3744632.1 hypothetical protein [Burkholderia sp. Se-20373]
MIAQHFWVDLQNFMNAAGKVKIMVKTDDNRVVEVSDFDAVPITTGFVLDFILRIEVPPLSIDLPVTVLRMDGHQQFKMILGQQGESGSCLYGDEVTNERNPEMVRQAAKFFDQASKDWVCESLAPVVITL